MLGLEPARQTICDHLHLLPAERVSLAATQGRFLRGTVSAEEDLPAFDRSAFDGYALRAGEAPAQFRIAFESAAGTFPDRELAPGECARIFTGAPLPRGADAVAMQELCRRAEAEVGIPAIASGEGVRWRGEDARAGAVLLSSGQRLGPVALALLAQLGVTEPLVAPRPRVFHLTTGSELVAPESTPIAGQIRDSNSTLIAALVAEAGGVITAQRRAGDDLDALVAMVQSLEELSWDVLLISGGASVGDYDFGRRMLESLGFTVHFSALNLRPGKPLIFATRGRQCAFVIPGNPLSHFVCWHVAIRAAFDALIHGASALPLIELPLAGEAALTGHTRETWWPARLAWHPEGPRVEPLKWQSSGDLTGLASIDALIRVPSHSPEILPGQKVTLLRL
jgi:molybdopterin molybdotransferase